MIYDMDDTVENQPQVSVRLLPAVAWGASLENGVGISCYLETAASRLTPLSVEIAGTTVELARRANIPASCVLIESERHIGMEFKDYLYTFGFDRIMFYCSPELDLYVANTYADALIESVYFLRPSIMLFGASDQGKDVAPLVSSHFKTGLTADCTALEILPDGNLLQTRPAFGGNVMAEIVTPSPRPQFATVRGAAIAAEAPPPVKLKWELIYCDCDHPEVPANAPVVLEQRPLPPAESITDARLLVAIGCGLKQRSDIEGVRQWAESMGGKLASTRGLVERGWMPPSSQIGLSGRTVAPDILITFGVSGSVQFMAGCRGAKYIIAVNSDPSARIFFLAHLGICCDLYEVLARIFHEGGKREERRGR